MAKPNPMPGRRVPPTKVVSVRLPAPLYERVKAFAAAEGISLGRAVALLLRLGLQ